MVTKMQSEIRVADAVWLAAALLTRERPTREDFSIQEIMDRLAQEAIYGRARAGLYQHVVQHCVANRAPSSGRYRMLFATGKTTRRLFRPGDPYDGSREGSKTTPNREELPAKYHSLLDWYSKWIGRKPGPKDSLLALRGIAKGLWADEHPDDYVRRMRD
jgi:hypothetical protein